MKHAKWDILVCSVPQRADQLAQLTNNLVNQIGDLDINIITLVDSCRMTIGAKRNKLLEIATGEYVSFIDDDDEPDAHYISEIYPRLDGIDYLGFWLQHYWNGEKSKPTKHTLYYDHWHDDEHAYYRNITHLNPIRRELAITQKFKDTSREEDRDWGERLYESGIVKTEHYVEKVLYHYRFNTNTSLSLGATE